MQQSKSGDVRRFKVTYRLLLMISEACEREDEKMISYIFAQPFAHLCSRTLLSRLIQAVSFDVEGAPGDWPYEGFYS